MLYLISYDLLAPGKDYKPLWKALEDIGAVRALQSDWTVNYASTTPLALANYCLKHMDANDRILVTEMPDSYAYCNLIAKPKAA